MRLSVDPKKSAIAVACKEHRGKICRHAAGPYKS
jgi:hypothetical protein